MICPWLRGSLPPEYSLLFFFMHAGGGRVGDGAAGRDLPLPSRQDGGDPRALTSRPSGNYTPQ